MTRDEERAAARQLAEAHPGAPVLLAGYEDGDRFAFTTADSLDLTLLVVLSTSSVYPVTAAGSEFVLAGMLEIPTP